MRYLIAAAVIGGCIGLALLIPRIPLRGSALRKVEGWGALVVGTVVAVLAWLGGSDPNVPVMIVGGVVILLGIITLEQRPRA